MVKKATLQQTEPPKKKNELIERPIAKKKKKKNYHTFSLYLFKLLRSLTKENNMSISTHTMLILNNFVNDMFEKIASEAGRMVQFGKTNTLGSREVQSAVKLLIPGELAKHANIEGIKALTLYRNRRDHEKSS